MVARALKQAGVVEYDEPVDTLLAIGMVKSKGRKMSKTEGNTVDPKDLIERYGADALRLAILAAAAPENDFNWSNSMVRQAYAFLNKVWNFCRRVGPEIRFDFFAAAARIDLDYSLTRKLARQAEIATSRITEAISQNQFHLVASNLEKFFERIEGYEQEAVKRRKSLDERDLMALSVATSLFLRMLTPLCPHIAEEVWALLGGHSTIAEAPWPVAVPVSS
jgi:leucyl-tRNA synthetase